MSDAPAPSAPPAPSESKAQPAVAKVDPASAALAHQWAYESPLMACRIDPTGRYLFASAEDRTVVRWEIVSGQRTVLPAMESWVRSIAFTPDGQMMLTSGYDGRLTWWPVAAEQPQPTRQIDAHAGWARAVAVSPDGALAATGGNDHRVKLWSVADGALIREITGHECHVYSVAFGPDGASLVSGDLQGKVHRWDPATGAQVRSFDASRLYLYDKQFHAHYGGVRALVVSPDGLELACGGLHECTNAFAGENKPLAMVFDFAAGELKRSHVADLKGVVWDLEFHPDGFIAAVSGGQGGGVLLFWKPEQEKEAHRFALPANARGMDLHPDGLRIATAHYDRQARISTLSRPAAAS